MLQIPALVRPGIAVVVSPLIALMQDQVAGLKEAGVRAEALNSSLDWQEAQRIEQLVRDGELDLLYLAPERLLTERCLDLLAAVPLSLFASMRRTVSRSGAMISVPNTSSCRSSRGVFRACHE